MVTDPQRKSILANNEDGILYRWDLTTNTFTQNVRLNAGLGQAYTPTWVGADGGVYAISNATGSSGLSDRGGLYPSGRRGRASASFSGAGIFLIFFDSSASALRSR